MKEFLFGNQHALAIVGWHITVLLAVYAGYLVAHKVDIRRK